MLITKREEVTKQGFCMILWRKLRPRGSLLSEFIHSSGWGGVEEGVGAYSRWVLIWNWALIRINTVVRVWNGGSFAVTDNPATGTSVIFIIPNTIFISNTTSRAKILGNPACRVVVKSRISSRNFAFSGISYKSQIPRKPFQILDDFWNGKLAPKKLELLFWLLGIIFFFFPWLLLTLSCAGLKPWKSWKSHAILNLKLWEEYPLQNIL